jgi:hypothetical protein
MFYLLLALPHVLGLCALLWIAYRSGPRAMVAADPPEGGSSSDGWGGQPPPRSPQPLPPGGGLPLGTADPPRRRLRVGEQLADLHPVPVRREHPQPLPTRAPQRG